MKQEKHKQWKSPYRRSNVFIKNLLVLVIKLLRIIKWWLLSTHIIDGSVMVDLRINQQQNTKLINIIPS